MTLRYCLRTARSRATIVCVFLRYVEKGTGGERLWGTGACETDNVVVEVIALAQYTFARPVSAMVLEGGVEKNLVSSPVCCCDEELYIFFLLISWEGFVSLRYTKHMFSSLLPWLILMSCCLTNMKTSFLSRTGLQFVCCDIKFTCSYSRLK